MLKHKKHLRRFLSSHKNASHLIEVLISVIVPVLNSLPACKASTLYGVLCMMSEWSEPLLSVEYSSHIVELLAKGVHSIVNGVQALHDGERVDELTCQYALVGEMNRIFEANCDLVVYVIDNLSVAAGSSKSFCSYILYTICIPYQDQTHVCIVFECVQRRA